MRVALSLALLFIFGRVTLDYKSRSEGGGFCGREAMVIIASVGRDSGKGDVAFGMS